MKYVDQLRDPRWQRKRLEIMERADFSCESCGDKSKTLAVHHRMYLRGRKAWEYENDLLECLCETCHEEKHRLQAELNAVLVMSADLEQVIGYAKGLYATVTNTTDEVDIGSWEQAAGFLDAWKERQLRPHDFLSLIENNKFRVNGDTTAQLLRKKIPTRSDDEG